MTMFAGGIFGLVFGALAFLTIRNKIWVAALFFVANIAAVWLFMPTLNVRFLDISLLVLCNAIGFYIPDVIFLIHYGKRLLKTGAVVTAIGVIGTVVLLPIIGMPIFNAEAYRNLIGEVEPAFFLRIQHQ